MKISKFFVVATLFATLSFVLFSCNNVEIWYDFDSIAKTASVTYKGGSYSAFSNEYIGEVVIPSTVMYEGEEYSVTSIGFEAFRDCSSLTSITIPESVTEIGYSAFSGCSSLTSIDVASNNNNYTSIDGVLFSKDQTILIKYPEGKKDVTSYAIPESVTSIGERAFSGCSSLTSVMISESVTEIGYSAFSGCSSLISVTIPDGVTSIGFGAFYGTALYNTESNWENNVLYIDDCLIEATSNLSEKYLIKEGTRVIGDAAFLDCSSLTSITLPESVTEIGNSAFANCRSLRSVTIPSGVTKIGNEAFYECTGFTSITCKNTTPPEVGSYTFNYVDKSIPLYVPAESVEAYKNAEGWKEFTNIQAIP